MIFDKKEIQLKNGAMAILRSPTEDDAASLLAYMRTTAGETPFLLRYPEECTLTLEREQKFLRNILDSESSVMILCDVGGEIAGNCQLSRYTRLKTCHRASVAIALVKKYWNMGIGTAMFHEMIRVAKEWGVEQLELEVIEGNNRAMALYKKKGFRVVSEKPNAIKLKDGTLLSEFLMIKDLM